MRKRTKKEFVPYNDYVDRPFGLKWGTAFAMDELVKTIDSGEHESMKIVDELPLMNRKEIDKVLQLAFLKSKNISIQLNKRNETGRLNDSIIGKFTGLSDETNMYMDEAAIAWEDIRNVMII